MQTDETRALIERYYDALRAADRDTLNEIVAPDVTWTPPASAQVAPTDNRDDLLEFIAGPGIVETFDFSKPFNLEVRRMIVEGDTAVVQQRLTATAKATGSAYDNQYCWIYTCRDGLIVDMEEYADTLVAARSMGWDL